MSKKKKKKKKQNRKNHNSNTPANVINPRSFFKKIGIKPQIKKGEERNSDHLIKGVLNRFGQGKVDEIERLAANNSNFSAFHYFHSNLELIKIWYGTDFNYLCQIATELSMLSTIPNAEILDVGGGPGHMAFWISKIWNPNHITVADVYSKIGEDWANQISENNVTFIDSALPALEDIQNTRYDIIVMSRVISFIDYIGLPDGIPNIFTEEYLNSQEAKELLGNLYDLACNIRQLLKPNGRIIIVESWSDARIFLIGRAFEKAGLNINLNLFDPARLSKNHSIIVFSYNINSTLIGDIPKALSTAFMFDNEAHKFIGVSAETLYRLFTDGSTKMMLEYESSEISQKMYTEIIEKDSLILLYRASNKGGREAWLLPGIAIYTLIKNFKKLENDLSSDPDTKILNMVLPDQEY